MKVELRERTEETVRIYFETVRRQGLDRTLPQQAKTAEEAVEDYRQTLLPGAKSYGRTIWVDGTYAGDVWCYGIEPAGGAGGHGELLHLCRISGQGRCRRGGVSLFEGYRWPVWM